LHYTGAIHGKQTLSLLVVGIVAEVEAALALSTVSRPEEILTVAAVSTGYHLGGLLLLILLQQRLEARASEP